MGRVEMTGRGIAERTTSAVLASRSYSERAVARIPVKLPALRSRRCCRPPSQSRVDLSPLMAAIGAVRRRSLPALRVSAPIASAARVRRSFPSAPSPSSRPSAVSLCEAAPYTEPAPSTRTILLVLKLKLDEDRAAKRLGAALLDAPASPSRLATVGSQRLGQRTGRGSARGPAGPSRPVPYQPIPARADTRGR
jgi:hypothetical protein